MEDFQPSPVDGGLSKSADLQGQPREVLCQSVRRRRDEPYINHDSSTLPGAEYSRSNRRRHRKSPSIDSEQTDATGRTNKLFYAAPTQVANVKKHTWTSATTKLSQEFLRMSRLVSFVAPEQFRDNAYPTDGPCDIIPRSLLEYSSHREFMNKMCSEQMQKNIAAMREQIRVRQNQAPIKSAFSQTPRYEPVLSAVLSLPTIWSSGYNIEGSSQANWPTQSEMQFDGDTRERLKTKCGRYLPPPRKPNVYNRNYHMSPFLKPFLLDETGPIYAQGPAPPEIFHANKLFNKDADFESIGKQYIRDVLMREIGNWRAPSVPLWRKASSRGVESDAHGENDLDSTGVNETSCLS